MQLEKERVDLQLKKQRDAIRLREEKVILERREQAKLNRQKAQNSSWQIAAPLKLRIRDKEQETIRFQKNQEAFLVQRQKEEELTLQEQKQSIRHLRGQRERSLLDNQHEEFRQRERNDDFQLQEQEHVCKLRDQNQKFLLQKRQELLRQRDKEQNEIQEENLRMREQEALEIREKQEKLRIQEEALALKRQKVQEANILKQQEKASRRQERHQEALRRRREEENVRRQDQEPLHQTEQAAVFRLPYKIGGRKRVALNHILIYDLSTDRLLTSAPTNVKLSACIGDIKYKIKHEGDLDLWITNRNIFVDKRKSISYYKGVKKIYAIRRPSKRNPDPFHKPTEPAKCIIDLTSVDDCIAMSCGHAITPENLLNYYWNEITKGCTEVECPDNACKAVWEFTEVRHLACLSTDEISLFLSVIFTNWYKGSNDAFQCPRCDQVNITACPEKGYFKCCRCMKKGKGYTHTFCTRCLEAIRLHDGCANPECQQSIEQTTSLLQNCDVMTIVDVDGCPTIRACPVCQHIIRYDDRNVKCKQMVCDNATCRTKFCFICLCTPSESGEWPEHCHGAYFKCEPAPRQDVNSS